MLRQRLARLGEGLPAAFWWLFTGALVSALATFVFPFLSLFLVSRGFTLARAGLIVALFGAGSILAGPLAGLLADRLGRRPTMVWPLTAAGLLTALLGLITAPAAIAAAVLALGIALHASRPAIGATVADLVSPEHRSRAFGLLYWGNNLGLAVSSLVGGALASVGYRWLFLVDAATTLACAAVIARRVPESRPAHAPQGAEDGKRGYRAVVRDRTFLGLLGLHLLFLLPFCQFLVAVPVEMARRGYSPAVFGRVLAVNGLLIVTLQPSASRLLARRDPSLVLAAAALLVGLGTGGYAVCSAAWHFAAATAVWSLGEILALPTSAVLVARLSPAALRGRYQGLYSMSFGLGFSAAPALGAAFMQAFGAAALWRSCLAVGLLAALGHLAAAGGRRRALKARDAAAVS